MTRRAPTKTTTTASRPNRLTGLRRRFYRPAVLLVLGLLPMSVVVVTAIRRSLPDLSTRPEYRVTAESIELVDPPPWVPERFVERSLGEADLPPTMSLLDDDLVTDLAKAFEQSPWVEEVGEIRKLPTGRVLADLRFRRPVAVVRANRVSYPVDAHGVLLPAEDFDPVRARGLPHIVNITTEPAEVGSAWVDPVLHGAAAIADSLAEEWAALGFAAIRLRREDSRGKEARDLVYEIVTRERSLVVWGRAPGSSHPGELTVPQKVGKLTRYLEKFESFEKPNGPYEIDIRHWREITRQRLATSALRNLN